MTRMAQEGIYPALMRYQIELNQAASGELSSSLPYRAKRNAEFLDLIDLRTEQLTRMIPEVMGSNDPLEVVRLIGTRLKPAMAELADHLAYIELYTPYDVFPYPGQSELVVQ